MKSVTIFIIKLYKAYISPLFGNLLGGSCRFYPTCSEYSREALKEHGILYGGFLSFSRIVKCNPWGGFGFDPVPKN